MKTIRLIMAFLSLLLPLGLFADVSIVDNFGESANDVKIIDKNTGWSFFVKSGDNHAWIYNDHVKKNEYDTLCIPNTYSLKGKVYGKDYIAVVNFHTATPVTLDSLSVVQKQIPDEYTIIGLADAALHDIKMNVLILGDSVKYINAYALASNKSLKSLRAPGVVAAGYMCFEECSSLSDVYMPKCELLAARTFYRCSSLTKLDLPKWKGYCLNRFDDKNCWLSSDQTFSGCTNLKEVNFPSLEVLGCQAFMGCSSLEHIELPKVKHTRFKNQSSGGMTEYCFTGCTNLRYLSMPELEDGCEYLLYGGVGAKIDTLILPKVPWIGNPFMVEGQNVRTVSYVDIRSAKSILGDPEELVKDPRNKKFSNDSIYLMPGIGSPAFYYVTVKNLYCNNYDVLMQMLRATSSNNFQLLYQFEKQKESIIREYTGYGSQYPDYWLNSIKPEMEEKIKSLYASITPYKGDAVTFYQQDYHLPDSAFYFFPELKSLTFGDSCTDVAYNPQAFDDADSLNLVNSQGNTSYLDNITKNVYDGILYSKNNSLLYYPLKNENIRRWHLRSIVTGIGYDALKDFNYSGGRTDSASVHHEIHLTAVDGINSELGHRALYNSNIDHVTFDGNLQIDSVGTAAFAKMNEPAFRYLRLPESLRFVNDSAFACSEKLQAVELYHTSLTSVGDAAFSGMKAITSIALPDSVGSIGSRAFAGNTAMRGFTVPAACKTIGAEAFSGTAIDTLYIPNYNETIESSLEAAFAGAAERPVLMVPDNDLGRYSGWTKVSQQTVELPAHRFAVVTRNYPSSVTTRVSGASRPAHVYRVEGSQPETNADGYMLLNLVELKQKDLDYVPANTPLVVYVQSNKADAKVRVTFTMRATRDDVPAWAAGGSWLKAAPAAMRIDRFVDSYGNATTAGKGGYENFVLTTDNDNYQSGLFVPVKEHKWTEEATLKANGSYLSLPVGTGAAQARGILLMINGRTTGIDDIEENVRRDCDGKWYRLDGTEISGRPSAAGLYIHNGMKVVVP